jgi:biotin carboxylase
VTHLRSIAEPFVVVHPAAARVRTRLRVEVADEDVLRVVGGHLGSLAGKDLAQRCREGKLSAKERAESRRERKRAITAASSSRWAGAITRTSEDSFKLAWRNLVAERRTLASRIHRIERRLTIPVGERRGYLTRQESYEKRRRLQHLRARLAEVERRLVGGRVSVCRGGSRLAKARHNLDAAGLTEATWRERWEVERLFICVDGEASQLFGNLTVRWHPAQRWLELRLPKALEHLANRPGGRYRLSCPVEFPYRGEEVAAQAESGSVGYDVSFDPGKHRWYLDASWSISEGELRPSIDHLRSGPVIAVDLNHGHLAVCVLDPSGNPIGEPVTVPLELTGLKASTRDGRIRETISKVLALARAHGAGAVVIEDLDFVAWREEGRERSERRPSRGKRGKDFRRLVAGLPTGKFRDRLVQMATNNGVAVIAVDPAYTSRWGAEHWLDALEQISPEASGHHAAALVIGRRGLGHRARRRETCDSTRAVHREKRAADSVVSGDRRPHTEPEDREAGGQPRSRQRTLPGERAPSGDEATEDRSWSPAGQDFSSAQCLGTVALDHPDGVIAFLSEPIPLAAAIAEECNLRFHSRRTADLLTNKYRRRLALARARVPGPEFWPVPADTDPTARSHLAADLSYPVVLKPQAGSGSRSTYRVADAETLLRLLGEAQRRAEDMLVEDVLAEAHPRDAQRFGDVLMVDSLVSEGRIVHFVVAGHFIPAPPFRGTGSYIPSDLGDAETKAVLEATEAAAKALGIDNGFVNTDLILTPDGPRVLEVNGRIGGQIPTLLQLLGTSPLLPEAMRFAVCESDGDVVPLRSEHVAFCAMYQPPMEAQRLVELSGLDAVALLPGVTQVIPARRVGDAVDWRRGTISRLLTVYGVANDHDHLYELYRQIQRSVVTRYEMAEPVS